MSTESIRLSRERCCLKGTRPRYYLTGLSDMLRRALIFLLLSTFGLDAAASDFRHPGVLLNRAQLDLIKQRVAGGIEPQKTAFAAMLASPYAALTYKPTPRATVECGSYSRPDLGCKDERRDSAAAYSQALAWYVMGKPEYARNAIEIMNAWARTLTGGHTNNNGPIQAAWTASVWPRAAEIIRHTFDGWAADDSARFEKMLREQYVPSIIGGSSENGNKELAMSEALINIGVFNEDRALFDAGVKMWRGRAPAYIYLSRDGPTPVLPPNGEMPYWSNKGISTPFVDGLLQESMRDAHHANMGFASMVNAAETARQQGLDLYAEQGARIIAAMEFQAQFLPPNGAKPPPNLEFSLQPTWEIAFNHFHHRLHIALPKMAKMLPTNRPTGADMNHIVWETLTHGDIGAVGLP
ncbi:MAG: alginate lyase family protein [Opitutaceae bacterium]|nr:alginate lyase family protein [Opitutaceae bacterium]